MVKHYQPSINEGLTTIFRYKGDFPPSEVAPEIYTTFPAIGFTRIGRLGAASNSTSGTIFTTPAAKDFFLTAASLGVIKDATSDSISSRIQATIEGVNTNLLGIPGITLTAQSATISIIFNPPIRVDRNTSIVVTNTSATANIRSEGSITGFTLD